MINLLLVVIVICAFGAGIGYALAKFTRWLDARETAQAQRSFDRISKGKDRAR